ncbi:MAG: enoyl-CoA hydratase [Protaetiibacter sp.]
MAEDLAIASSEGILTVTLDRPATRNALSRALRIALVDELARADADPEVRVVILTGTDPAFSSGVDITELFAAGYRPTPTDPATQARRMTTPTIAAVNGACVTGGLEIALACTFAVASDRAVFADTHAKVGLVPGWGMSAHLPAAVGAARAARLSLTGQPIDAATALAWGLVTEVVPHAELLPRCRKLAASIAAVPEPAIRATMELARDNRDLLLDPQREHELVVLAAHRAAGDGTERRT